MGAMGRRTAVTAVRMNGSNPTGYSGVKRGRRRGWLAVTACIVAASTLAACGPKRAPRARRPSRASAGAAIPGDRGWTYLKRKLVADGVPRGDVDRAFSDPRMPAFSGLSFSPHPPREGKTMYRNFLGDLGTSTARRCRSSWGDSFERAQRRFGVDANVCAAIITVETQCGRNTGRSVVLYRVARLAMAKDPYNFERNVQRWGAGDPDIERRLLARAQYLEDTFYPEVRAVFTIARQQRIDPLGLRGSGAGAFGYPQFLPTSYLKHAVDGNGDGRVSLYDADDAAASCANYLSHYGWRQGISRQQKRAVIWRYNRSEAYIDTVLALADRLGAGY
jgi:membrane-bound lytic murein transglycosylase B